MSKIIVFDIETSPVLITKFQFDHNPYINPDSIQKDWFIISAAWKEVGKDRVHSVAITKPYDDYNVVKTLRDALSSADIIVGHHIDSFDIKSLTTRLVVHGLPPLPNIPTVDTRKEAKKLGNFTSNKLDYLSKLLFGVGKIKVDFELWLRVLRGEKKAIGEMVTYNKMDVVRNEEIYLALRPYMKRHPHAGVLGGEDRNISCTHCGSVKVKRNGIRVTAAGLKKQELQCQECGAYSRVAMPKDDAQGSKSNSKEVKN